MAYPLAYEELKGSLERGTVIALQGQALLVSTSRATIKAQRAAGCLLAPQGGDQVLVALLPDGQAWVTCVLTRSQEQDQAELSLPDRTVLRGGDLAVECENTRLASRLLSLEGSLVSLSGGLLLQGFGAVQTAARRISEAVVRKLARYGDLKETTAGLEQRQAGRMRITSRGNYRLRSESADIQSKAQMSLDAERIKVG